MEIIEIERWLAGQVEAEPGLLEAKLITTDQVVTAHWVRLKCRYGCTSYGRILECPPYSPTVEEFRSILAEYRWAALLKVVGRTPGPADGLMLRLEQALFRLGFRKAFALGARSCGACKTCLLTAEACPHPERVRPSMESVGIDTTATVRHVGWEPIAWDLLSPGEEPWSVSLLLID